MRSSKSRSRSKSNRNRQVGNVVNRVFDSSGPEGKVRGTPQQIIDKYNQLARDAQLSGDRVATENFQQHAEHYLRMLAEAMREQAERQAQQQQQQQERQQRNNQNNNQQNNNKAENQQPSRDQSDETTDPRADVDAGSAPQPDVIEIDKGESALVETPEDKAPRQRRRKPRAEPEAAAHLELKGAPTRRGRPRGGGPAAARRAVLPAALV